MRTKQFFLLPCFLLVFLFFCILDSFFLPFLSNIGISLPLGASFTSAAAPRTRPILSALPLPLSESTLSSPEVESPSAPEAMPHKAFAAEPSMVANTLQIKNSTAYPINQGAMLSVPLSFSAENPKVLILHTHTSEAYAVSPNYTYVPSDPYRTEDPSYNICRVGDMLKKTLEENGIGVIHDTKSHDYPSYSGSYNRSLETIEKNLAQYPSIEIVLDIHRDALADEDGSYMKTQATIDGATTAQALIIVGTDAGGLPHPDWSKNLALGLRLQKTMCDMYPTLCRPLHLRTERFNGHASPGTLLIEIGSCGNTMEEALRCASYVGNALSKMILSFSS